MKKILSQTIIGGLSILAFNTSISYASDITCVPSQNCEDMGYKQSSADCPDGGIKCLWDTTKLFCSEKQKSCDIGSILYSDKSCSNEIVTNKEAVAVVFDVNKRLAVSLVQSINTMSWCDVVADIPDLENCRYDMLTCGTNGKTNTATIIAYGQANGISYPAAEFCAKYSTGETDRGQWYLPSMAELSSIYDAKAPVNASIELLGGIPLLDGFYWSSNEHYNYNSGEFDMMDGYTNDNYKRTNNYVRAIIAY